MTRVAFVGSSHLVAVWNAEKEIRASRPDLKIDFFAVTGGIFFRSQLHANGIFRAGTKNRSEIQRVQRLNNGKTEIDLSDYSLIWVIGFRFGLRDTLELLRRHDVLGWRPNSRSNHVSEAFFRAAIDDIASRQVTATTRSYANDPRVVFSPAPFPAALASARGPRHDAGIANIHRHPMQDEVFRLYNSAIANKFAMSPCSFLPQPAHTLHSPFVTKNEYLASAQSGDIEAMKKDVRHMNAPLGMAMFLALAQLHLPASLDIPNLEVS